MKKGIHFLFGAKDGVTDFPAVIDRFAALGFDCVELPPEPFLEDGEAKRIVSYAAERGVEVVFSCGFAAEYDMASDDPEVRQNGVRHMERILSVMDGAGIRLLGGTCQTKWPSLRTAPLSEEEKRAITARTVEVFAKAVSTIGDRGIEIAIEPLNRFEGFLINTAAEGVAFCEMVGNDNVGLMLDNFHLSMEEDSFTGAVHTAGKRLKHLHLAENNRRLPGMGQFLWDDYFAALRDIGYAGRLDIESFMTPGGGIAASVALWRSFTDAPEEQLLRDALDFLREKERVYF